MENIQISSNFSGLMPYRITSVLLVCSSYDQFTLEEDGLIEAQIHREYAELSLSAPPRFTRASGAKQAIKLLKNKSFDVIISMFNIGDVSPFEFARKVKFAKYNMPFVLLTSFSHEITRRLESEDLSGIDYVFGWQGNAELLLAIIKMLEDKHNAKNDMDKYGVQAILLVEDSIRFYSAYLPDLYKIVLQQTDATASEALNEHQRALRKRARPKILFARNFEQAKTLYERHKDNLLGVISDIAFPRKRIGGKIEPCAGIELCSFIRKCDTKIPLLIQSSDTIMRGQAKELDADFIDKNSKTLFSELSAFIHQKLAFGKLKFIDPVSGVVLASAGDLRGMQAVIETLPDSVLLHYSRQNMYSKWLYARGLFAIAGHIRPIFVENFKDVSELRHYLCGVIKDYRRAMGQGVIAEFNPETYNEYITFARSGSGSLGGKARGLAFVGDLIEQYNLYDRFDGVRLTIPRTLALTTEYFEEFMSDNALEYVVADNMDDTEILSEFVGARLPARLLEHLRVFLRNVHRPLAVRSSSNLEDSHYQPFAGVYSTYMVPRTDNEDRQLRLVSKAIKSVYASVFFAASRSYIASTGNTLSEESMGVVIQEICGTEQDGYYFPTFSGVARSLNFYPIGDETAAQGVCNIALGLGKSVVEGGKTIRFSPAHPRHALQLSSVEMMRKDTQKSFYALNLDPSRMRTSVDDSANLQKIELGDASSFRNLKYVCSTWDMDNERVVDSFYEKGFKLVTFSSILKYDTFPLADIIKELLEIGEREMLSPVEIEFAVNMDVEPGLRSVFNFLQIRPIAIASRSQSLDWGQVDTAGALLYSRQALGVGRIEDICDLLYVKLDTFDASKNEAIAVEIGQINETMAAQNRNYAVVGPGRWGSSDPWLGIPVKWAQISQSRFIAECGLENYRIDPSQGTHFFQNLTSFGVGYVTLNPFCGDGSFDLTALDAMPAEYESEHLRLVRFAAPLYIFVDGKNSRAIIRQ